MLLNYLKVTFRTMTRNKLFTFINIAGMSVSLACAILLFLYVNQELSYDRHYSDSIYRLTSAISQKDGMEIDIATSSVPIAPVISEEIPEIISAIRTTSGSLLGAKDLITYEQDAYYIEQGFASDPAIFSMFNYDIILGDKENPLPFSNAVVLEKDWAVKLFGNENPIGKSIKISTLLGESDYEVSAVYDKSSHKTHLNPNYFISMENATWKGFLDRFTSQWVGNNLVYTYVSLEEGADVELVNAKIHEIFLEHGGEEMKAIGLNKIMSLQPVGEIHTTDGFMANVTNITNLVFIQVLALIGVLILLLACVNYVNLSTAQAGNRMLEVGVRKVMGVTGRGLIFQFIGESFLIVFLSLVIGVTVAILSIPVFNQLVDNPITQSSINLSIWIIYLFIFLVVVGLLSGIYPALYLSSFKPSEVLKGKNKDKGSAAVLRKVLVVFQFVISIVLISAIIIISKQVDYIKNKDLGFDPTTKLIVPLRTEEARGQYKPLNKTFQANAAISKVSGTEAVPGAINLNDILVYKQGQTMDDAVHIYNQSVDIDYVQTLGVELVGGTFFTGYFSDSVLSKVLINEEAVRQLGLENENAPGEIVYFDWQGRKFEFEIVGVVKDIHQVSLHNTIDPLMFNLGGENQGYQYMILEANLDNFQNLITDLKGQWDKNQLSTPFEYFTLNENLQIQYEADFKTFNLIKYFALISVLISSLGLYAMSMFVAERRFKEIGVRKALGARVSDIFIMVSKDLSLLIVIAFLVSIPISYLGMSKWLESFAYRITPGVGSFLLAGALSILIGWIAISYQSIKAALTNPVNVLRDE